MIPKVTDETLETIREQVERHDDYTYGVDMVDKFEKEQPNLLAWMQISVENAINELDIEGDDKILAQANMVSIFLYGLQSVYAQAEINEMIGVCHYCGKNCPYNEEFVCDGYAGDLDNIYH